MESLIDYYLLIIVVIIALFALHKDVKRYADHEYLTKIKNDRDERIYIASRMNDENSSGAKILMVLYSLYCRKCHSSDVFVELSEDHDYLLITCRNCDTVTRIKLAKLFIDK